VGDWGVKKTQHKFLSTDNQSDNKYFATHGIFIKLNVLKFAEKNYFCGGNFRSYIFKIHMAKKKKDVNPTTISSVEETLTRTEQYLEENYKTLLIVLVVIVVLVGLGWLGKLYFNKRNDEAQSQMFQAERYLEKDSLKLALNGDGNYLGFLDIARDYKFTNSGNLAKYAAGICYLHMGNYNEAIEFLNKYSKKDKVIGSLALGAIGDAYVELGNLEKGVSKYIEAADFAKNSFNTPLFLMKAGELDELSGKFREALELYQRIENKYPESTEGTTVEKYIARVKLLIK
jgi:tetratricopeptide (TPR) repeat protein